MKYESHLVYSKIIWLHGLVVRTYAFHAYNVEFESHWSHYGEEVGWWNFRM